MPSSVIHGMLFSPERQTLDIVFRDDRGTYRYYDVRQEEWRAFKRAPSKGTYLNAVFKARHPRYERFGDVPTAFAGALAASVTGEVPTGLKERPGQPARSVAPRDVPDENVWGFYD